MIQSTMPWKVAMSGPDLPALAHAVAALPAFRGALPRVRLDTRDFEPACGGDWLDRGLAQTTINLFALWDESFQHFLSFRPGDVVQMAIPGFPRDPAAALEPLSALPFEVASFGSIHPSWRPDYDGPGFGGFHIPLGWGCAFRGDGHRRVVSRRWLEHGPWKVWHGANDTTLIQFHDLDADAATALAQARPGHDRMGPSDTGGYLAPSQLTETALRGLYNAGEQKFRIPVSYREVTSRELLDACAVRASGGSDPSRPIRALAYLFLDEAAARQWVGELWLREIECWAVVNGAERRLDLDYRPADARPAWAKR